MANLRHGHRDLAAHEDRDPPQLALDQQPFLRAYYVVQDMAFEMKYGVPARQCETGTFLVTKLGVLAGLVGSGRD